MSFPPAGGAATGQGRDPFEKRIERWGGPFVALLTHVALAAILGNMLVHRAEVRPPERPLRVQFLSPEPEPPPPPPPNPPPRPAGSEAPAAALIQPVAATSPDGSDEPDDNNPSTAKESASSPASVSTDAPPDLKGRIKKEVANLARDQDLLRQRQMEMDLQVAVLAMKAKSRKFPINSDGGRFGAIRTLDVSGVPEAALQEVFKRYKIRIEHGVAAPATSEYGIPSFLNAAVTKDGTYRNAPAGGVQDIFVLSAKAVGVMALLETHAIQDRGMDPIRTRVREIQFGIVKNKDNEWDLGVTKLVAEQIE